ncbi:hypothetical protein CsSME_00024470 [Camellia sinensis var. sinensis]
MWKAFGFGRMGILAIGSLELASLLPLLDGISLVPQIGDKRNQRITYSYAAQWLLNYGSASLAFVMCSGLLCECAHICCLLSMIREGRVQGVGQCLVREYRMVCKVIRGEVSKDFVEGCRAILLDKDNNPKELIASRTMPRGDGHSNKWMCMKA